MLGQALLSCFCEADCPGGFTRGQQALTEHPVEECRSQCTSEVGDAVTPVEACICKAAALGACAVEIEAQAAQEFLSRWTDAVLSRMVAQTAHLFQAVSDRYA